MTINITSLNTNKKEIKGKASIFQIASLMKCSYHFLHFHLQWWHKLCTVLVHSISDWATATAINGPYSQVLKLPSQSNTWWADTEET